MACAFLVGGVICLIGQLITNYLMKGMGMEQETASAWNLLALILISIILTGLNIYPKIVQFGGAGALVPITGLSLIHILSYPDEAWREYPVDNYRKLG